MLTFVGLLKEGTKCKYGDKKVEVGDRSLRSFTGGHSIETGVRLKYEDGSGTYVPMNTKVEVN